MSFRADFIDGARAVSPLLLPGAAVGLVTGVAGGATGLSPLEGVSMGLVVHSPTVMLTAFSLLQSDAPVLVLLLAPLVVGVRFALLSLSIAPYFARLATRWRWTLAYFLWTPTYALSIERYDADPTTSRRGYYLGAAAPLWVTFQSTLLVGIVFGARVPPGWHLDFVVPLAFVALLVRMVSDRPSAGAALAAGVAAVLASALPLNVGVVVAGVVGTAAGVALSADGGG